MSDPREWLAGLCRRGPLLGLLAALLSGCATSHGKRTNYRYEPDYGVASPEFERALTAQGGGLLPGNKAVLLNNGDSFYPAILDAIRSARHSVNIEMYIYAKGEIGQRFASVLSEKAREGVTVRLLVDSMGARLGSLQKDMLKAGVHFQVYKPVKLGNITKTGDRSHRKIITVDGRIGFTGGLAIDDRWLGNGQHPNEWRETVVQLEGPVVHQLQRLFLENWLYATGEFLDGEGQFPVVDSPGEMKAQAVGSSRASPFSVAKLHYYMPIQAARNQIWIENAYFLPDRDFRRALAAAARRGVDVRLVLPGPHSDITAVHYAARRYYLKLLEAGVKIYEYQPAMLHSKVMLVDGIWSSIGSINFTPRSMKANAEANVAIYDETFASDVKAMIEADLVRSVEITFEEWKRRGFWEHCKESYFGLYEWLF